MRLLFTEYVIAIKTFVHGCKGFLDESGGSLGIENVIKCMGVVGTKLTLVPLNYPERSGSYMLALRTLSCRDTGRLLDRLQRAVGQRRHDRAGRCDDQATPYGFSRCQLRLLVWLGSRLGYRGRPAELQVPARRPYDQPNQCLFACSGRLYQV